MIQCDTSNFLLELKALIVKQNQQNQPNEIHIILHDIITVGRYNCK